MNKLIVIVTGGTGGHIFPGLVISQYLKDMGFSIKWIGSSNRMECVLVPKYDIYFYALNISKVFFSNIIYGLFSIFSFFKNILLIIIKFRKWKPILVLGFGGYISVLGIISAWLCGINTVIHEQNILSSRSNKLLSYIATKVLQSFANSFGENNNNAILVGNPIRSSLLSLSPKKKYLKYSNKINILVLGGSQGALTINMVIPKLVNILNKDRYNILHQVGFNNFKDMYKFNNIHNNYVITDFIDDINEAYCWADLVICRSGALTISEICTVGIASILIPYTYNNQHQYLNAKFLENVGAAIIVDNNVVHEKVLANIISQLTHKILFRMANSAHSLRVLNSNEKFMYAIKEYLIR